MATPAKDNIYHIPVTDHGFKVSDKIVSSDFLHKWASVLMPNECTKSISKYSKLEVAELTEIPEDILEELYSVCCPEETLYSKEDDLKPNCLPLMEKLPSTLSLLSIKYYAEELKRRNCKRYVRNVANKMKYFARQDPESVHGSKSKSLSESNKKAEVTFPDVLYTVKIYKPLIPAEKRVYLKDEFHMLGSQYLWELRDVIRCCKDYQVAGELSANPSLVSSEPQAHELFKSAMFFIEGIFYDDMRDPANRRYSQTIIDWMKKNSEKFPDTTIPSAVRMDDTRFTDISLRLGQAYTYIHQGDCEHCIVFSDMRLLHPEDCLYRCAYPLQLAHRSNKKTLCLACMDNGASWTVKGFAFAPQDPCQYCDKCFRIFHYDSAGRPVGDFQAYAYVDDSCIT